jgi:sulfite reductase alpha subunit-like flavoprotein
MYKSFNLSIEFIVQKCDTIMPRYYTIASSAVVSPNQIKIAISLSTFTTVDGTKRYGLTSAFLNSLKNGSGEARIFVKDSNFDMNNNAPLLMVGPGTGVVPFIAFAEEREHLKVKGDKVAEGHLFFGCRDKDNDFIYRDYLAAMVDTKVLSSLSLAFSRPKDGSPKQYV